jgi:hypothetical protein
LRWRGFIDALILSDTSCEIVDYKTGVPKSEHEEQVRFYSLLWARDAQLNPTGRTVNRLTLSYSTTDVAVEPLTRSQLNVLEQETVSRSNVALNLIQQFRRQPYRVFTIVITAQFGNYVMTIGLGKCNNF